MEFRQLESFCAVVRYQSFTKAAEKLYISQPTISTHIRMLEQEFNSRLIIRTTKNIEITPHGKELFACAQKIFTLKNDLIQKWSEENKKIIRIMASSRTERRMCSNRHTVWMPGRSLPLRRRCAPARKRGTAYEEGTT